MEYRVIHGIKDDRAEAQAQLEAGVNAALSEGWVCAGGISFTVLGDFPTKPFTFSYAQAVIRTPASPMD
jgi:hypothetical protein